MSTLIITANLITECDSVGAIYSSVKSGIDPALLLAQTLATAEQTTIFASDVSQFIEWIGATQGMYGGNTATSGNGSGGAFGSLSGFGGGGGAFGGGSGILSRYAMMPLLFNTKLENMRKEIARYGSAVDASIIDLGTYAAFYNLTPYTILYTPTFASAFFTSYSAGNQLPAASVFAPEGIAFSTATITGTNTVSLVAGFFPFANGYVSPAPTPDSYGYNLYVGGMPSAQGFAPPKHLEALITTTISGTCALTVTCDKDTGGGTTTWTGTLDSATTGSKIALTPTVSGARAIGLPTTITISGTATTGEFIVQSGLERAYT